MALSFPSHAVNEPSQQRYSNLSANSVVTDDAAAAGLVLFADDNNSQWSIWDCCGGSTPTIEYESNDHGGVAQFVIGEAPTVMGFFGRGSGSSFDATSIADKGQLSFDLKIVTAPINNQSQFMMKVEANGNTSFVELPLSQSNEGVSAQVGQWQTFTFDISTLQSKGLDISGIDIVMMFPAWGTGSGAVYRVDNVMFTSGIDMTDTDMDGVIDSEDAFPNDPNETIDTDGDSIGNNADTDDDGDNYLDSDEILAGSDPLDINDLPIDSDGDFVSDFTDTDDDGDGISDLDEVANGSDPLDAQSTPLLLNLERFSDFDGDGIEDWLGYSILANSVEMSVLSGDGFISLARYSLAHEFANVDVRLLADHNGDGSKEVGLYGFNTNLGRYQLVMFNGESGRKMDVWNWPNTLIDARLEVLDDITGDGVIDYAIHGIHSGNGTRQLIVKDGQTQSPVKTFAWPDIWDSTRIVTMSDMTADGTPEVALYGRHIRTDRGQLFVQDGASANKYDVYNWNKLWTDIQLIEMDDIDGDGTKDWGQFGKRKDDGRYQWLIKKGHDKRGVMRTFSWPADLENVSPMLVSDRTSDGIRDVAIVGTSTDDGKVFLRINDGKLANTRIANVSWPANWANPIVQELGDLNADGFNEYALLGHLKSNGNVQLVVKDGQSLAEYGRFTISEDWQDLILYTYDVSKDNIPDVMISGMKTGSSSRHYVFLDGSSLQQISTGIVNNYDLDGDGVANDDDAFPFDSTETTDTDLDGVGNNADTDDDGDGYSDEDELNGGSDPLSNVSMPDDFDGDFIPDYLDEDDDNDGVNDNSDFCENTAIGVDVDASGCEIIIAGINDEVSTNAGKLIGGLASQFPGFTLYVFDNDTDGSSTCNGGCATNWPPLLVANSADVSGVARLTTITRDDGTLQIAYNQRPLYFFAGDTEPGQNNGDNVGGWHSVEFDQIDAVKPLYDETTTLEPIVSFVREDGVVVTRVGDRGRDRHAKDNNVQDHYDHYLAHYWEYRTARVQLEDHVLNGESKITATFITESELGAREFRVWFWGRNTTGQFHFNPQKQEEKVNPNENGVVYVGRGTWNNDFEKISDEGSQFKYTLEITEQWKTGGQFRSDLVAGTNMEFEISQFLLAPPAGARKNYYGTSYVYVIGQPGLAPFEWQRGVENDGGSNDGTPIPAIGLSGGDTTLGYNYTNEPAGRFMQMATNLSPGNAQPFVRGRRVHHTDFVSGIHDEREDNPIWAEQIGKAGNHYINHSCAGCHVRNGRARVAKVGDELDLWVFKVGDENGNPDANIGRVLQPEMTGSGMSEGSVRLGSWTELANGLRSPNYEFTDVAPARFSARIAPKIVGLGLLDALDESTILEWADPNDEDNNGISGRAALVTHPQTGETHLGRFGYKASAFSVEHQIAAAFNTDIGVMTSLMPNPDCGSEQTSCGDPGQEIDDEQVADLVKYISLLGVGARRDYDNNVGETIFTEIGCANCHRPTMKTGEFHPFAELRNQVIHPYSDMLLHDMGPGLADNLDDGNAQGSEWRTAPLWGLGHDANVTLGDAKANDLISLNGDVTDTDAIGYLHDGRARTIDEAIRWHGGEGLASKLAYDGLSQEDKDHLLDFLNSL